MTLYVYKTGTPGAPVLVIENAASYAADRAVTEDGTVYGPFAADCELSSKPDCSETLRADWRRANPSQEARMEELESLVAELLFGGSPTGSGSPTASALGGGEEA